MLLTVIDVGAVVSGGGPRPLLGRDQHDRLWVWLEDSDTMTLVNTQRSVPQTQAAPVSPVLPLAVAVRLAALLPAWLLVGAGEVKLGSSILVSHAIEPAKDVLSLSRAAGARWRALGDAGLPEPKAEFLVPFADTPAVLRELPERPDAVIVLSADTSSIGAACRVCRDMGVVVLPPSFSGVFELDLYPDIHRRGLKVKLLDSSADITRAWTSLEMFAETVPGDPTAPTEGADKQGKI